jgi:cytochrome P450
VTHDPHAVVFNLLADAFQQDPAATFADLRTRCPVNHTTVPSEHYTLSRHADVFAALRDDETWSSKFGPGLAYGEIGAGVLVSSDPPGHTTERLAIARAFKPSVLEAFEPDIRALVDGLIDAMVERGPRGDIVRDMAMPLPLVVMCWMLGMPPADISLFRSWVLPMAEAVAMQGGREANQVVIDAYRDYHAYFGPHIATRAAAIAAGETVPDDLLTRLLTVERDGQKLTQKQIVGFCQFLLVAGSATTTLLVGNVVERLMRHPDQMALVQADRSLIPNAIEESLRIDSPVHGLFRTNNEPVTIHDVDIPADAKVYMLFGSANLDPDAWEDPDRFDVTRDLKDLRKRHAAFGVGIHYCLGAPLSRIEAAVALEAVLDRMPAIRPDGEPTNVKASVLKGFESLPVRWD